MSDSRCRRMRGFTLIEVVVALFVIAIGIGALMTTLASSADSVGHLREKSFAEWVALNRISELRLDRVPPAAGIVMGTTEYAGSKWRWRQEISDQGIAGILRIDVSVAAATADAARPAAAATTAEADFPALATAYGFVGTSVATPSGIDPDWSLAAAPGAGGPPPGGPPAGGAPSTGKPP